MGQPTQIMGGRVLNSEVVIFSTRLAVQASPLYKNNGEKAVWQPPIFVSCLLIGLNGFTSLFRPSSMSLMMQRTHFCSNIYLDNKQ